MTDFTSTPNNKPTDESEAPMFSGVPSWERNKKARGFSAARPITVAAEPRSFAPADEVASAMPPRAASAGISDTASQEFADIPDGAFATAPTYATRATARKSSTAPIMIMAGVILVGGMAAAGWYAMRPHTQTVAQLTPGVGAATTTEVVSNGAEPAPGGPAAQTLAPTPIPPVAARSITTTTTVRSKAPAVSRPATAARARPAAEASSNASTTAPVRAAPTLMPTQDPGSTPLDAAAPAPLVLTIPQAAPAKAAPTQTAPNEALVMPQTAPAPAPTQTPPT